MRADGHKSMPDIDFLRPGHTFIIAEAGVNHNGSLALANRLIDAAAEAGADAIKFQTFKAEGVAILEAPKAEYQKLTTGTDGNQLGMLRQLEVPEEWYPILIDRCAERGITFLSTPHDWEAIDILEQYDVPLFKVGSGDLTNLPFLQRLAWKGRPIIFSTGMGNLSEVEEAVETMRNAGNEQLIVLHCTTSYPSTIEDSNLKAMHTLSLAFGIPVGYSDHTEGMEAGIAAVALGAQVIEKHFTLDRSLPGPDHKASLEPQGLREFVAGIRQVEKALGNGLKRPTEAEVKIRPVVRKSIIAATDILQGTVITEDMLTTKRPGSGISPKNWGSILGQTATVDITRDSLLRWDQFRDRFTQAPKTDREQN